MLLRQPNLGGAELVDRPEESTTGATRLTVDFAGRCTDAFNELTFGRRADIVLDVDNLHLHGLAGRFTLDGPSWFLENVGSKLHLRLVATDGYQAELPPGASTGLPRGRGEIRLHAGPTRYQLDYEVGLGRPVATIGPASGTVTYGRRLTPAQIDYAVTLGERRLRSIPGPLPSHARIADLWGVSQRTVAKTFEDIRHRLRAAGVRGIDTPEQLVEHLVANRLITLDDLWAARLHELGGPVRHAETSDRRSDRP